MTEDEKAVVDQRNRAVAEAIDAAFGAFGEADPQFALQNILRCAISRSGLHPQTVLDAIASALGARIAVLPPDEGGDPTPPKPAVH